MVQWVLVSYTIEEKNNMGSDTASRRKNNRGLMLQWVLLSYTIEEKKNRGLMLQWVLLSYTIEEKNNRGLMVQWVKLINSTVSTVKLYNRRKNKQHTVSDLMVQWVLLSYTIEEKTNNRGLIAQWVIEYC